MHLRRIRRTLRGLGSASAGAESIVDRDVDALVRVLNAHLDAAERLTREWGGWLRSPEKMAPREFRDAGIRVYGYLAGLWGVFGSMEIPDKAVFSTTLPWWKQIRDMMAEGTEASEKLKSFISEIDTKDVEEATRLLDSIQTFNTPNVIPQRMHDILKRNYETVVGYLRDFKTYNDTGDTFLGSNKTDPILLTKWQWMRTREAKPKRRRFPFR